MNSAFSTTSQGASLLPSGGMISETYRRLRTRYVAYKTRQALSQLTASQLDDIGLSVGDIDRIARRSAGS